MPLTDVVNGKEITIEDEERQPCEIWDRVMGYYRPVTKDGYKTTEWNTGKVSEHLERVRFKQNLPH